jgi:hypothetical protein
VVQRETIVSGIRPNIRNSTSGRRLMGGPCSAYRGREDDVMYFGEIWLEGVSLIHLAQNRDLGGFVNTAMNLRDLRKTGNF